jgi:hypothetical protein
MLASTLGGRAYGVGVWPEGLETENKQRARVKRSRRESDVAGSRRCSIACGLSMRRCNAQASGRRHSRVSLPKTLISVLHQTSQRLPGPSAAAVGGNAAPSMQQARCNMPSNVLRQGGRAGGFVCDRRDWAISSSLPLLLRRPTAPRRCSRSRRRRRRRLWAAVRTMQMQSVPPRRAGRVESKRWPCAGGRRLLRRVSPCACSQVLIPGAVSDRDRVTTGPSRLIAAAVCLRRSALARASRRLAGRRLLGARLAQ